MGSHIQIEIEFSVSCIQRWELGRRSLAKPSCETSFIVPGIVHCIPNQFSTLTIAVLPLLQCNRSTGPECGC
ncbi:hypothetical protein HAX54_027726 [Datura stramonium]|uniref:Uncharacterized protein n=1 Tax=Datura stramonium TaxID=4076 RepID=A0ABS8V5I9_DATST|nr:hypothetical protein [Datura stramonium]